MRTMKGTVRGKTNTKVKGRLAVVLVGLCAVILLAAAASKLADAAADRKGNEAVEATPLPTLRLELADVDDNVDIGFLMELIGTEEPETPDIDLSGDEPRVLIYHTHTKESYFPTEQYSYAHDSDWRCQDDTMNICAVGERLAEDLRTIYGIEVIHDTTNHVRPNFPPPIPARSKPCFIIKKNIRASRCSSTCTGIPTAILLSPRIIS